MARFDLTDFEWSVIEPLLPTKVRSVPRAEDCISERHLLTASYRCALGWYSRRYGLYATCVDRFNR